MLLPQFCLGSALSFAASTTCLIAVVLWQNVTRMDRALLTFSLLLLAAGTVFMGFFAALAEYRFTRARAFARPEWRVSSIIFGTVVLAAIAAFATIKSLFPELPE